MIEFPVAGHRVRIKEDSFIRRKRPGHSGGKQGDSTQAGWRENGTSWILLAQVGEDGSMLLETWR